MTRDEAIDCLSDGHTLWKVEFAKEVCEALGVEFSDKLIRHYKNQKDANPTNSPKGLWLADPDKAIDGVNSLNLSDYVTCKILKCDLPPSSQFIGRGFGAQANAGAVKDFFALNAKK